MPDATVTIPLSGSVSGDIDLTKGRLLAILVPAITSGDLLIQGAFDATSASFAKLMHPANLATAVVSGDLRFATGPGSRMILWPDWLPTPSYLRLETSVPQAAARDFTVRYR